MGVGRFACVALPLILTGLSAVFLLYAGLAGVSHEDLHLFRLNTTGLSISPADAGNLADKVLGLGDGKDLHLLFAREPAAAPSSDYHRIWRARADSSTTKTSNITAADLGLAPLYDVTLWGYCAIDPHSGKKTCSPHQFDWASKHLSSNLTTAGGVTIQLPKPVKDALTAFRAVLRAADIAFVAALLLLGAQLVVGFFATFSRAVSCLTWLLSTVAALVVGLAAGTATALALIVLGVVDSTAKFYGVHAYFDTKMLAVVWIAVALAMAASVFWIATICCCKPGSRRSGSSARGSRARDTTSDAEKLLPTGFASSSHRYAPIDEQQQATMSTAYVPTGNRSDLAYEPYSHRV